MRLRPASGPVGDPFFARVRRRHPDLDLILLPPEAPDAAAPATAEPEAEQALAGDLVAVEEEARRRFGLDARAVLARGSRPGTVRARVRVVQDQTADGSPVVEVVGPDRAVGAARVRSLVGGR